MEGKLRERRGKTKNKGWLSSAKTEVKVTQRRH